MKSCAGFGWRILILALFLVPGLRAAAEDWPQWRGPNRDNISSETGLLTEWPPGGPPLEWLVEGLGEGIATVSIANGQICTVGYQSESEYAIALSQATGELLWATRIGSKVQESPWMRWLTQRTPTLTKDRAYFFRADGDLVCLNTTNGAELWRKSYAKEFAVPKPAFGFCDYPLVLGDRLICIPGGPEAGVVALNRATGEVIWKCPLPGLTGGDYSACALAEIGGVEQIVEATQSHVFGIGAADGKILWDFSHSNRPYSVHTPFVRGDEVLAAPYASLSLLKVTRNDSGFDVNPIYTRYATDFTAFQDRTIAVGDHVFAIVRDGTLACLSRKTGETLWPPALQQSEAEGNRGTGQRRGRPSRIVSSPVVGIFADGHLITRNSDGVMKLFEASPKNIVEKSKFTIPIPETGLGATSPVISDGRLYLRDDDRLFCYDVRAERTGAPPRPGRIKLAALGEARAAEGREPGPLRSVFVPTPPDVVARMLEQAKVQKTDIVYDLGSGDGRIVIAAAMTYGCRAVGYEIDERLVELSRENAKTAGVTELVTIEPGDLFKADLSKASVITLYLLPEQLEALVPQLTKLRPGTRIVSHQFPIPRINAGIVTAVVSEEDGSEHKIYTWTTPVQAQEGGR